MLTFFLTIPPPDEQGADGPCSGEPDASQAACASSDADQCADQCEEGAFRRIMELARDSVCPLKELYGQDLGSLLTQEPETAPSEFAAVDGFGNPRWITLAPVVRPEEKKRGLPGEGLLPEDERATSAVDRRLGRAGGLCPEKGAAACARKRAHGFGGPVGFFRGLSGKSKQEPSHSPYERGARVIEEKGLLGPRKMAPMRNFFRMALVVAVLGMLYHLLAQRGWVPPLF